MNYIPKLSPTVGNGLGGLPYRKCSSEGSSISVTGSILVANAFYQNSLIFRNKDTNEAYAFDWFAAPRGPSAVNLTSNYSIVQTNTIQQFLSTIDDSRDMMEAVFTDETTVNVGKQRYQKNSDTSFSYVGAIPTTFSGQILVLNSTHYIEYKLTQTTVSSKMRLTLTLQKRNLSDNSNVTSLLEKYVDYTSVNIEASISSYTENFRLTQTSTGKLIGIFYIHTYTTSNIYKNGFLHTKIAENFLAANDITLDLKISSYNSSYASRCYGSMYGGHITLLGADDYYGAILFENSNSPSYYPIPYFYVFKDGTQILQRVGSNITSSYYIYTHMFGEVSYSPTTSFLDVGYTDGVINGTYTLKTIGITRRAASTPYSISLGTVSSNATTTTANYFSNIHSLPMAYGSDNIADSTTTIEPSTASVYLNFKWNDASSKYGSTLFAFDLKNSIGQLLYENDYGTNTTTFNSYIPKMTVKNPFSNMLYAFRKDPTNASYDLLNTYLKFANGSYVLHGISQAQGGAGTPCSVLEKGTLFGTSPFSGLSIDFRSAGGKILFGAQNNAYIGV